MGVENATRTRKALGWEVHQATGTIIGQTSCSADEALDRILRYAHSSGASVDEVADDILADRIKLTYRPCLCGAPDRRVSERRVGEH